MISYKLPWLIKSVKCFSMLKSVTKSPFYTVKEGGNNCVLL